MKSMDTLTYVLWHPANEVLLFLNLFDNTLWKPWWIPAAPTESVLPLFWMICKIYSQLFSEGLLWMDATRAESENVCMWFGWTDPLTLHSLLAGVWLEIRAVKAMAMWPSWSSTTCSPTSSVTNSKWSFDMNTHWYKLSVFIVLHCAFCHLYVRFEFHWLGRRVDVVRLWADVWWRPSGPVVWVGELQPRSHPAEHHYDTASSHGTSVWLPHEVSGQHMSSQVVFT